MALSYFDVEEGWGNRYKPGVNPALNSAQVAENCRRLGLPVPELAFVDFRNGVSRKLNGSWIDCTRVGTPSADITASGEASSVSGTASSNHFTFVGQKSPATYSLFVAFFPRVHAFQSSLFGWINPGANQYNQMVHNESGIFSYYFGSGTTYRLTIGSTPPTVKRVSTIGITRTSDTNGYVVYNGAYYSKTDIPGASGTDYDFCLGSYNNNITISYLFTYLSSSLLSKEELDILTYRWPELLAPPQRRVWVAAGGGDDFRALTGTLAATASLSGALRLLLGLLGSIPASAAATATPALILRLAGSSAATALAAGTISLRLGLAGSIDAIASVLGDLTVPGMVDLSGSIAANLQAQGDLSRIIPVQLTGTIEAVALAVATLRSISGVSIVWAAYGESGGWEATGEAYDPNYTGSGNLDHDSDGETLY